MIMAHNNTGTAANIINKKVKFKKEKTFSQANRGRNSMSSLNN